MALAVAPNSYTALRRRLDAGILTWRGPALMLFARPAFGVGAQALVAAVFVLRSSPTPWHDAEPWLPVYGTLIDAGCLTLLWWLTRREGFRLLWGLTEQMTYNGYLVSRFQVLSRSTGLAIACVAFVWALQHVFMPLTFDAKYMAFRLLGSLPYSVFQTLLYLRFRRLVPFAIAHALLDGSTVWIGALLPRLGRDEGFPCRRLQC